MSMASSEVKYAWQNGQIIPFEDAAIHPSTPGVLLAANVIEAARAYWNEKSGQLYIFRIESHLQRLRDSAKMMRMPFEYSIEDLVEVTDSVIEANEFKTNLHIIYLIYIDNIGAIFEQKSAGTYIGAIPRGPEFDAKKGINLCTSSWTRFPDNASPARIKCGGNYQSCRLASLESRIHGYDWALLLNQKGKVAEAPGACLFMIRGGRVVTPSITSDILESITRQSLIDIFKEKMGIEVVEREVDRSELYVADEAFLCGTAVEITPVVSLDKIKIGDGIPGPVTREIQSRYLDIVTGVDESFSKWRHPVYKKETTEKAIS